MKRFFHIGSYEPDPDRDVQGEIESHLDLEKESLMARGMSEEE